MTTLYPKARGDGARRDGARSSGHRVWAAPLLLAAISAIGLTAALVADGAGDAIGSLALAVPVAVAAWCSRRFLS